MIKHTLLLFDRLHWLWLVLAAPFLIFPSPKRSLAMLVIPALFLLFWMLLGLVTALHQQVQDHLAFKDSNAPFPSGKKRVRA